MKDLHVALIQSDLYWEQPNANLGMFEEEISKIEKAVDLIVLPEMFTTGFSMNAPHLAEPPGGSVFKWMRSVAKRMDAAITGSYMIRDKGKFFNRLYFVYPDGSSDFYDKRHLFTLAGEDQMFASGTQRKTFTFRGWRIRPQICYDLRFPVWARSEKQEEVLYEYDLLLYVANWPEARIKAWDALLKARAIENSAFSVGVNRTGRDENEKIYPGHSATYQFDGESLLFMKEKGVGFASLSGSDLLDYRKRFNFQQDADAFQIKPL